MKVPLRGRGGKQDKLKESKSAFSLHSAVIYLNFLLPVWGSGMSQWSSTPLRYLEIIARCRWPCCALVKIDPIQDVISFSNTASTILYQRVFLSCKKRPSVALGLMLHGCVAFNLIFRCLFFPASSIIMLLVSYKNKHYVTLVAVLLKYITGSG